MAEKNVNRDTGVGKQGNKPPQGGNPKYNVTPVGDKIREVKLDDAVGWRKSVPMDNMHGGDDEPLEYLRVEDGNILEARGRDVSNEAADVDGWGGDDAEYKGMAIEASYGMGAGGPGAKSTTGKRGDR